MNVYKQSKLHRWQHILHNTYDIKCLNLLNRSFFPVPEHKTVEPEMCESTLKKTVRGLKNSDIWQCDFWIVRTRTVLLVTFSLNCLNLENWNFNVGYLMGDGQARWMSRFILKSLLLLTKPKWYPPQKWAPTWVECKVSSLLVVSWCC